MNPQMILFVKKSVQKYRLLPPFLKIQKIGNDTIGHNLLINVWLKSIAVFPGAKPHAMN
jgi:hypothetical protein